MVPYPFLLLYQNSPKAEAPFTLIDRKSTEGLKTMSFPNSINKGIKIDTGAPFVTFEVVLEMEGQTIRKFSVFGVE